MPDSILEPPVVRVLLVEESEEDYVLTRDLLAEIDGTHFELDWVRRRVDALREIEREAHDVYLVNYQVGGAEGLDIMNRAIELGCNAPVILLTSEEDGNVDIEALRRDGADYLVKGELVAELLGRSIRYALLRKRTEKRLAGMAQYDELTGLANRALFKELVTRAVARTRRREGSVALLFLDLDNFKTINDTLGHSAGDVLLKQVAERLVDTLRETDLIARLGGDEFVVILEGVSRVREAALVARRILKAQNRPFAIDGQEIFITTSVGIAIHAGGDQDVEELIKNADMAMYKAKERGRNSYHFHTSEMTAQAVERMALENNLRHAIDREEFLLDYQPQIDLASGQVVGVEALVRWRHPDLGLIGPDKFIPVAEDTGLIVRLGDWVMRTACAQAVAWQKDGLPPIRMAVNLSTRQFQEVHLAGTIQEALEESGLDPRLLEVELTEGPLAQDAEQAVHILSTLKATGVRIAIDDFGTGYSSLSHLKRFPLDALKIDASFVRDIATDPDSAAIVTAIVALAHALRLEAIAEGVETKSQLDYLAELGCDAMQGYLLCRPVSADDCAAWIRRRGGRPQLQAV